MYNIYELKPDTVAVDKYGRHIVKSSMPKLTKGILAITADWCGYCKQLKDNVLKAQLIKPFYYYYIDGSNSDSQEIENLMASMGRKSFPKIFIIGDNGILQKYEGDRAPKALIRALA